MKKALQITGLIALVLFIMCMAIFIFAVMNESTEAAPQDDVQDLKKQILELQTEIKQMKSQIQDLYFMTEPLRFRVVDRLEGSFYYSKTDNAGVYGMLPSQLPYAELYYDLRSANNLGWTQEKIKMMSDRLLKMPKNPFLQSYDPAHNVLKAKLRYDPDGKMYFVIP